MKHKLLFSILCLSLWGCKSIMLKAYGIKNPEIEDKQSILKNAEKYNLDTSNFLTVSSEYYLQKLKEANGIPNAAIYDSIGNYIEYRKTDTSCNAGLFDFIPTLKIDSDFNKPLKSKLQVELAKYRNLEGQKVSTSLNNDFDFYLLIYCTTWSGRLNKNHVKVWEMLAKNNQNCKIKTIKVNLDMQQHWDKNEQERIISNLSKK